MAAAELTNQRMEKIIRDYFEACNSGDVGRIAAYFTPQAVHYFTSGMYQGPFRGAETIARKWSEAVAGLGSYWTVDQVICDAPTRRAVIEWTHFKRKQGIILRGDEWYIFNPDGRIEEIRAYYASAQDPNLQTVELGSFDYVGRGYPIDAP